MEDEHKGDACLSCAINLLHDLGRLRDCFEFRHVYAGYNYSRSRLLAGCCEDWRAVTTLKHLKYLARMGTGVWGIAVGKSQ